MIRVIKHMISYRYTDVGKLGAGNIGMLVDPPKVQSLSLLEDASMRQ